MIHSKLLFFPPTRYGFDKVAADQLILLTASVATAATQHTCWWTIARLISCKRSNIQHVKKYSIRFPHGFNAPPGLNRICIDCVSEGKLRSLNAFIARVLCSEHFAQGHRGLEELWTRVSSPWWVNPALCPEPSLLWIHLNRRCMYGFINGDVDTLWSMTEWSQPLMALNYNLFLPFELAPWGWLRFGKGGGIVLKLCRVKARGSYLDALICSD